MNDFAEEIIVIGEFAQGDINFIRERLAWFKGGIMKIYSQPSQDRSCMRLGLIESAVIENNELKVKFVWLTRGDGYLSLPPSWTREKNLHYVAEMESYVISGIDNSKLMLNFFSIGDTVTLFSPNGNESDYVKTENSGFS